ncbi:MAG: response regulator [Chloroflexi bacterium]|nr:response regulator [Chloroflexota bacterium]
MSPIGNLKKKLRILIADDVHETRRNTRLMIAAIENTEVVAIASNGRQAVEMTEEQHPDIVILDINMPEMDGLTAYKQIAQAHPDTACIVISAEDSPVVKDAAAAIGVQEYLVKPFFVADMEAAIQRIATHMRETRQKRTAAALQDKNSEAYLEALAHEYMKDGRIDDQAIQIFERLAMNPNCALRWLETLAMIYAIRQDWGKLKALAARLEEETKKQK